jgi:hypothetical protein
MVLGLKKKKDDTPKEDQLEKAKKQEKSKNPIKKQSPVPVGTQPQTTKMPKALSEFSICRRKIVEEIPQQQQQYFTAPSGQLIPQGQATSVPIQPVRTTVYEPVKHLTYEELVKMANGDEELFDLVVNLLSMKVQ